MIDTVWLEDDSGKTFRLTDYGLILKTFQAPEPNVKEYRESVEGADGDIDMTEWAGVLRYETRTVDFAVRDMTDTWWRDLVNFCHGRNIKITHSRDPEHYFYGRCTASHETQQHITDVALSAVCNPYRLAHRETVVSANITGAGEVALEAARRPVTPTVTVAEQMSLSYDGAGITLLPGTHEVNDLLITDTPKTVTVTGTGLITFRWRDGVL